MKAFLPLVMAAALLPVTQAAPQVFRSRTDTVSVFATVQDSTTRLVPNLKQEDFVITDDGKEQPIVNFSNEVIPFSAVVILDRSGSMYEHQIEIREGAMSFVVRLHPDDQARIASFGNLFGNHVAISPSNFTSNKADLIDVLQVPIGLGGNSPIWISIDQSITALSGLTGRKVIVIFSDGKDEPMPSLVPVKLKDLIDRVRTTEVMVYALAYSDIQQRPGKGPKVTPPDPGLLKLADESGGGYFEVTDTAKLSDMFTRIAEELHQQYVIGFAPPLRDGKIHKIAVKVKQPGMTVRARQTYVAPSGG
jgi:Ca-activated chloride channel family protein